jgi:hypothetical protein
VFGRVLGVEGVALFVGDVEFNFVIFASQKCVCHGDFPCAIRNQEYTYLVQT